MSVKLLIEDLKRLDQNLKETHFLLFSGVGYSGKANSCFFSSFDTPISKLFGLDYGSQDETKNKEFRERFIKYNESIKNYYSYVYIPTDIVIEDFTKLETQNMQKLIGKNINDEIAKIVGDKNLNNINNNLNKFIKDLESDLPMYSYKNKSKRTNISMNELTQKIIELFFSIRTLHKSNIEAEELSSGEKRQALVDVVTALINRQEFDAKELILAIDEPEVSLNISKIFNQFQKLFDLSIAKAQVLITSHWYGFLPIVSSGNVHFIYYKDKKPSFKTFDLFNYREKIKQNLENNSGKLLPSEIELKSINDLTQSIVSSLKLKEPYNWLICEGSSEKIYFEYYFKDLIKNKNLRILPVGGAKEVKRLYDYLELPLREKENIKGKIFCLIDTDENLVRINENNNIKSIVAKRIFNENKNTILIDANSDQASQITEIEDCLNGKIFMDTLKDFDDDEINTILEDKNNISDISLNSFYSFNLRDSDREKIKNFFDLENGYMKIKFAKKYIELAEKDCSNNSNMEWIDKIKQFFMDK
ncbi:TOPRIM nucleotidyl transferase/hydrolase domain-containing protein [Campylobacter ureolyticus]|uniref:TOPRIM nucleotidyl transferase/hydrolase domain-containing protein n=1 Tax=Campylobacter ureolyticus TaxID=827 RepID=UPI00207E30A9|nr:TOPRIM nucleotidyl transferase/hydrolase domain-containing protein [Campylobacter ureolyticus]MCZ6157493.1 hypothetical protein [Campylobacter ureolyticus]GKH60111.1 hypothetical protein CE91St25_04470 [Campylobacter ureolyticus]